MFSSNGEMSEFL